MYQKSGFTLIELLVVVLIIGILSSVALPQYQKAVAKSRVAESQILLDGIIKAQMVYQMANGEMASKLSDLDISLPCELDDEATHPKYICNNWHLNIIYPDTPSRYIEIFPINLRNISGFSLSYKSDGSRFCRALANSSLENFLCKDLGYTLYRAGFEGGGAIYNEYRK